MSSMIKKKTTFSFKPKAPQIRRPPGAPPSATSSTRQSIERQSQTPAPSAIPSASTPPALQTNSQESAPETASHQNASAEESIPATETRPTQNSEAIDTQVTIDEASLILSQEVNSFVQGVEFQIQKTSVTNDEPSQSHIQTTSIPTVIVPAEVPVTDLSTASQNFARSIEPVATAQQDGHGVSDIDLSVLGPGESDRPSHLIPTAQLRPDGTSGVAVPPKPEKKIRRPAKRRKLDENGIDIRPTIEVQINRPRRVPTLPKKPRRLRDKNSDGTIKRKKREETPEDAEEQVVDHTTVKMAELTRDLRIGKKFSRHTELKQREIDKRIKAKFAREHPGQVRDQENEGQPSAQAVSGDAPGVEANSGPQMRLVNGQIVIDDASLVVDRHAIAAAASSDMEEVEEDDFTRITTSGTFMKREKNMSWDFESNEKFYNGLRMFGTDFEMISKMFPDRNRRQIKLKFNKEEREFPRKVANALIGEAVRIDLDEYKSHTGLEYEEVADIEAEHALREEEHNAEQQRMQAEADETVRQKRAAIQSRGPTEPSAAVNSGIDHIGGADSAKEKASAASKSKKKSTTKKKKRNLHSIRGGGEEVEVLGTIDG